MTKSEIKKTEQKVKALQKELGQIGPFMRGSVVILGTKKQIFFSLNKNKKTQLIYLGKKREKIAMEYSLNYKKLLDIVEEMTQLNMSLLKKDWGK